MSRSLLVGCGLTRWMVAELMEHSPQVDYARSIEGEGLYGGPAAWRDADDKGVVGTPDEVGVPGCWARVV